MVAVALVTPRAARVKARPAASSLAFARVTAVASLPAIGTDTSSAPTHRCSASSILLVESYCAIVGQSGSLVALSCMTACTAAKSTTVALPRKSSCSVVPIAAPMSGSGGNVRTESDRSAHRVLLLAAFFSLVQVRCPVRTSCIGAVHDQPTSSRSSSSSPPTMWRQLSSRAAEEPAPSRRKAAGLNALVVSAFSKGLHFEFAASASRSAACVSRDSLEVGSSRRSTKPPPSFRRPSTVVVGPTPRTVKVV